MSRKQNALHEVERVYAELLRGTQQITDADRADAEQRWRESVDPHYADLLNARERPIEATETDNG